jgi:hypothetical protein
MSPSFLAARIIHVCLGVFWAGALVFNAAFLLPAMQAAGPNGAAVAAGLMRRRFLDIMPVVALLNLLTGFILLWRVSGGFTLAFLTSSTGLVYDAAATAAVIAFALGAGIMRPAMLRAAALSQGAAQASATDRDRMLGEAQALRLRAGAMGGWVAWLLGATTVAMAIARYV